MVACFKKKAQEAICVGTNEWKGETRIFIRTFVSSLEGDDLVPTRKGISLPKDKYLELLEGLRAVGDVAGERDVARIAKSERYEVRVGFRVFKGIPLVSVRTYVRAGSGTSGAPRRRVSLCDWSYTHSCLRQSRTLANRWGGA